MNPGTIAIKVMMKYAGNKPISLLRSEYQGCAYQKEKPIHEKESSSATKNFALVVRYTAIHILDLRYQAAPVTSEAGLTPFL